MRAVATPKDPTQTTRRRASKKPTPPPRVTVRAPKGATLTVQEYENIVIGLRAVTPGLSSEPELTPDQMMDSVRKEVYNLTMDALARARRILVHATPAAQEKLVIAIFGRLVPILGDTQAPDDVKDLETRFLALTAAVTGGVALGAGLGSPHAGTDHPNQTTPAG